MVEVKAAAADGAGGAAAGHFLAGAIAGAVPEGKGREGRGEKEGESGSRRFIGIVGLDEAEQVL